MRTFRETYYKMSHKNREREEEPMAANNDNRNGIVLLLPICLALLGIGIGVTAAFFLVKAGASVPRDILAAFARVAVAVWLVMLSFDLASCLRRTGAYAGQSRPLERFSKRWTFRTQMFILAIAVVFAIFMLLSHFGLI